MRYLIYSCCFETPHLETEMEVANKMMKEGHEVFFLICEADLKTCFLNPEHSKSICNVCQSKIKNGLKMLGIPKDKILNFQKKILKEVDCKNALNSLESLKSFQYKDSDIGLAVASSIISACRDHRFDVNQYKKQVMVGIETAIMVHENADQILNEIKPDAVIMFNGRFIESRPVMRLCEKMNIDFYTHERGGQIDRYMFRKNSTPHSLTFVKAEIEDLWEKGSNNKEEIGKKFFEDRRNKIIQTWHVYTEKQIEGSLPMGFDPNKRNIGIFNSSMDEYEGIADYNNKLYKDDNEGIEKICASFIDYPEYHFYLRVHPNLKGLKNTQNKKIIEIGKRYKNITIISAEDKIDSYALMEAVEAVISFASTMGVEALYWNKPSILLGRSFYEDFEGIIVPNDHDQAIRIIKEKKNVTSPLSAIKYGYWCVTYGTKFEFFNAESLFSGNFLGKKIKASLLARVRRKLENLLN
ncbi:MAG: hypothetical protein V4549_01180 [Bacteroidota bacterium]